MTATCITSWTCYNYHGCSNKYSFSFSVWMGTNAFFAFSLVKGMNIPWEVALAAVFVEGIIFIILSLSKIRENIINAIPMNLKYSISVGIGFFIAFIGLVNSNIIVKNEATLIGIGNFMDLQVLITLLGFVLICVFEMKGVRGSILLSI
nr:solute carrier family 23 protein [Borrelia crocidurae]